MNRRGKVVAALAATGTLATGAAAYEACGTDAPTPVVECLDLPVVDATPGATPWPSSTLTWPGPVTFDARGETFTTGTRTDLAAVKLRTPQVPAGSCLYGGTVTSDAPEDTPWEDWHHHYGIQLAAGGTVTGTRIDNVGDGVAVYGPATVDAVHMTEVHDDCVEDDKMAEVTVARSLLDGCGVAFSAWSTTQYGPDRTFTVVDSLIRLRPDAQSYDVARYGEGQHGGFFKFQEGRHPRVVVRDSVFRADQPGSYGGNVAGHLSLPPGSECGTVTLIGSEAWPEDEVQTWIDQCDGVIFGTPDEWDRAVEAWEG